MKANEIEKERLSGRINEEGRGRKNKERPWLVKIEEWLS
jgi:hypothetical protein